MAYPKNFALVEEALKKAKRFDLIGTDQKCLVRPQNSAHQKQGTGRNNGKNNNRNNKNRQNFAPKKQNNYGRKKKSR